MTNPCIFNLSNRLLYNANSGQRSQKEKRGGKERRGLERRGKEIWGDVYLTLVSGARSIARYPSTSFLSVSAPAASSATAVSPWPSDIAANFSEKRNYTLSLVAFEVAWLKAPI